MRDELLFQRSHLLKMIDIQEKKKKTCKELIVYYYSKHMDK